MNIDDVVTKLPEQLEKDLTKYIDDTLPNLDNKDQKKFISGIRNHFRNKPYFFNKMPTKSTTLEEVSEDALELSKKVVARRKFMPGADVTLAKNLISSQEKIYDNYISDPVEPADREMFFFQKLATYKVINNILEGLLEDKSLGFDKAISESGQKPGIMDGIGDTKGVEKPLSEILKQKNIIRQRKGSRSFFDPDHGDDKGGGRY